MKELSIEEKAKAYDEAVERAKEINNEQCAQPFNVMTRVFPELKEESEDERIRKAIGYAIGQSTHSDGTLINGVSSEEAIAWLEKQGDKCLVNFDKAEQEKYDFVSGQYIECRASFNEFKEDNSYWFEYIGNDTYIGRSDNILNKKFHITPRQLFTLFTQQHCPKEDSNVEPKFNIGDEIKTQSEESLTITKIDDKGYWSEDLFICNFDEECIWDLVEQKPAWSEEEENA